VRRLSFFTSAGLELTTAPVVSVDTTPAQIAERAAAEVPYLLVTGADGKPLGWAEPKYLAGGGKSLSADQLISYGRPFEFGRESLRDALDCAVLSPTGWAVAVDGDGRVVGVTSQATIGAAIRSAHAERGGNHGKQGRQGKRGQDAGPVQVAR
jgi:osmoprotectant transport system ATP-binding protein